MSKTSLNFKLYELQALLIIRAKPKAVAKILNIFNKKKA
jgi:hypothetical protein